MKNRLKIAEFQSRLKGLVLGHATPKENVSSIMKEGLTRDYNFACVEEGWVTDQYEANVQFRADVVADRTYPDPEGQWDDGLKPIYSIDSFVEEHGMDAFLDVLEGCFNGEGWMEEFDDPMDPQNYNLVVVGPVPPEALIR